MSRREPNMTRCEDVRRALDRVRDGEAREDETAAARAHADTCAACARDADRIDAVGERLRARADATPAGAPVPGLRDAVLARLHAGEAPILDLRPFLLRTAVAAAAVIAIATGSLVWQTAATLPATNGATEAAFLDRDDVLHDLDELMLETWSAPGR